MKTVIFTFVLIVALSLHARTVLLYNDYSINASSVDTLITRLKNNYDIIRAENISQFENAFAKQKIDVAILSIQDEPLAVSDFPEFAKYVTSGGKVIFADGNRGTSWTRLLGFAYTGRKNESSMTLLDRTLSGSFGSARQTLYNPGYRTFSMGLQKTETTLAQFENGDAAILFIGRHIMINGFLLDTDKPFDSAPERLGMFRAVPRGSTASLIAAQVSYLLAPPAVNQPHSTVNNTQSVGVPLSRNALAVMILLFALSSAFGFSRRKI